MKKIFLLIIVLILFISCGNNSEIEQDVEKLIKALNYADTAFNRREFTKAEHVYEWIINTYPWIPEIEEIKEKVKPLENRLDNGYKDLKWGISKKQARKLINKKVYAEYNNALQFKLSKLDEYLTLFFYKDKFYAAEYELHFLPEKDNYHNELLTSLTEKLQEIPNEIKDLTEIHDSINMPLKYFYWEDKYTTIALTYYDFEKEQLAKVKNVLTISYGSRNITKEKEQDEKDKEIAKKLKQQEEQEKNLNRIKNNL